MDKLNFSNRIGSLCTMCLSQLFNISQYHGIIMVFIFTQYLASGDCSVTYIYNGHNGSNSVEEGTNVTISCYFDGNKPKGSSRWARRGQFLAVDCTRYDAGIGIISPNSDCAQDNGDGFANYSFEIHNVSLDYDRNTWTCQNTGLSEALHFPITVTGKTQGHSGKNEYVNKDNLIVTADIGCSYPPGEVLWCLDDGSRVKCSNESNWAADVFVTNPTTYQTTETCSQYTAPNVFKYWSTITGTIRDTGSSKYKLYYSLNAIDYKDNVIIVTQIVTSHDKNACLKGLPTATLLVQVTNIAFLVISTIFTGICRKKVLNISTFNIVDFRNGFKENNYILSAILVLWILNIILFLISLALYITLVGRCFTEIAAPTILFAVACCFLILSVVTLVLILRIPTLENRKQNTENQETTRKGLLLEKKR